MTITHETYNSLKALDTNQKESALAALERATGKLELILARDPKIALAPISVSVTTIDVVADVNQVTELRKEAKRLINDGQVQAARHLLENLASETVISMSSIPLATYPAAIKRAVKLIDEDKQEEAKKILQLTLNTLIVTKNIIPLPILTVEEFLKEAEKLSEKAARTEEENKRLSILLTDAREKLKFAEAIGYGSKQDFKNLYAQLDEIEHKTANGKSGTGFFNQIKRQLSNAVSKVQINQQD